MQIDRAVNEVQIAITSDGRPRLLIRVNGSSGYDYHYWGCEGQCADANRWAGAQVTNAAGGELRNADMPQHSFALDSQNRPRFVYGNGWGNGQTHGIYYAFCDAPAPNIFVGGKLYYGWCEASCTAPDAAFQIVQVASGEGMNVDLAIDAQGRTHMVYDAGQRGTLGELWCDTNCASAGAWQRRILETSAQLMQEFAPASPFTCDQQERAWFDAIPSVAFSPAGQLVVAYDIKNVATCYYTDPTNPSKPPSMRVERIWWGVRWATFARQ